MQPKIFAGYSPFEIKPCSSLISKSLRTIFFSSFVFYTCIMYMYNVYIFWIFYFFFPSSFLKIKSTLIYKLIYRVELHFCRWEKMYILHNSERKNHSFCVINIIVTFRCRIIFFLFCKGCIFCIGSVYCSVFICLVGLYDILRI